MHQLLIKNGMIVDGTGAPGYRADIAVRNDVIEAIGVLDGDAERVIDAGGRVVAPGFIDIHTHTDLSFLIDPLADSKIMQGVTLEVTGNCGMSFGAPLIGEARESLEERLSRHGLDLKPGWTDFGGYLDALEESGSTVNLAAQVGHGTVRTAVMGMEARSPSSDEMAHMRRLIEESLDAGALGISTGLWYAPGSYSLTEEVVALTEPAAERGVFYSTHTRSQSNDLCGLMPAQEEAIEIGRRTGARIQIAHVKASGRPLWGRASEILEGMERARQEGIDVAGDQYPYAWSSTALSAALFPRWALAGGREAVLQRLGDADTRQQVREVVAARIDRNSGPEGLVFASFPEKTEYEGLNLGDVARDLGCDAEEAAFRLFEIADAQMIVHSMSDEDVYEIAGSPLIAVASDGSSLRAKGPLSVGKPHPRNYSTNARFFSHMVREKGIVGLEEAVRKMTTLPASRLGLTRRGRLAPGYAADVVVFDPDTIADKNTFAEPHVYPVGVQQVLVNGIAAVEDGVPTEAKPGRVLRSMTD